MINVNRGAEWNIWDLHIHTPDTILNNQFRVNWSDYIDQLEKQKNVKAIGVTNYFNIDDYFIVKKYKDEGRLSNINLILPNVELRLDQFTSNEKGINLHIIFSDDIVSYIQSHFLDNLTFQSNGGMYRANKADLIRLGRDFSGESELSNQKALKEGTTQFKVRLENVIKTLKDNKRIFEGKYLIGASNNSKDGVSGIKQGQQKAARHEIYRSCDFIFSSNPSDRDYFLSEKDIDNKLPCIHGSDAHMLEKICKPDKERHTWIKSEISFEGLKQIIHEPDRRVKIQEQHPENKSKYNIIDKIEYNDVDEYFGETVIPFSSGLNVIIGGKSSGKSILLYKIAQCINHEKIKEIEDENLWNNHYRKTFIDDLDARVIWKDNSESLENDSERQVLYIPQMYINSLAEKHSNKLLQEKIRNILLKDSSIDTVYSDYMSYISTYNSKTVSFIEQLQNHTREKNIIQEQIKSIGNIESIEKQIKQLEDEIITELKNNEITQEDQLKLDAIEERKEKLIKEQRKNENEIKEIKEVISKIEIENKNLEREVLNLNINGELEKLTMEYIKNIKISKENFDSSIYNLKHKKDVYNADLLDSLESLKNEEKPIKDKMKQRETIDILNNKLEDEKDNLIKINELKSLKKDKEEKWIAIVNDLKDSIKNYYEKLTDYMHVINESNKSFNGIYIVAECSFNQERFEESFISKIDGRKLNNQRLRNFLTSENKFALKDNSNYVKLMEESIDNIIGIEEKIFKMNHNNISILQYFTEPFLEVTLNLKDGNDLITEMSPGKSGLVILKLLTNAEEEKYPILIDQPEDNLDNRTISTELVQLIRNISEERQVILVTHNANLSVLTDAENIIVANQDTSLKENENYRFEYINGPLESIRCKKELGDFHGKSIKEHVCDVLEGGMDAFEKREKKYIK